MASWQEVGKTLSEKDVYTFVLVALRPSQDIYPCSWLRSNSPIFSNDTVAQDTLTILKMATFFILLMVLGASTAFPTEDETRPTNAVGAPAVGPEPVGPEPVGPVTDLHPGSTPDQEQGPGQESGPEGSDLKTDNTYWWRRSYYPYGYGRSYYPRVYSYYTPRVYSYYSPYSYWGSYW